MPLHNPLLPWELKMGAQMGALPGMHIIYAPEADGELRCDEIDYITDFDGWRAPAFVIDAEFGRYCKPDEVIAIVLPCANPDKVLAEVERWYYETEGSLA